MKTELIIPTDLKKDDLFSFRTMKRPIWWRFIEIKNGLMIYEGIRDNKYQFSSPIRMQNVLVKIKQE